jgi:hypothetical protein
MGGYIRTNPVQMPDAGLPLHSISRSTRPRVDPGDFLTVSKTELLYLVGPATHLTGLFLQDIPNNVVLSSLVYCLKTALL